MDERERVTAAWSAPGAGERYARARFASRRAGERDPRLVRRALARHGVRGALLDVPAGSGRLAALLGRAAPLAVAADSSAEMLAAHPGDRRVRASVFDLPFADRSFDAVVCCRLLHHLREPEDLERAVAELVRVSARLVVASFWDAGSLSALRERLGLRRAQCRAAIARGRLAELFARAGATVVGFEHSLRFVSRQAFAVALRIPPR
jgi:SAM-dependent methyltransferase